MSHRPSALDIDRLKQIERDYEAHLRREPSDTGSRMTLAWCLALEAIYEAGQTDTLAALMTASETLEEPLGQRLRCTLQKLIEPKASVQYLLRNCLQQVIAVTHLSANPQERHDAEQLCALLKLSGGEQVVQEADENSERILSEITHAILTLREDEDDSALP